MHGSERPIGPVPSMVLRGLWDRSHSSPGTSKYGTFLVIFTHYGGEYNKISCCQEPSEKSPKIRMQVILNWISNIFFSCQRHRNFLFFPPMNCAFLCRRRSNGSTHTEKAFLNFHFPFCRVAVTRPALETPFT